MAVAVIYRFALWERGERRLVTEDEVSGSTLAMLGPQLSAVPHRSFLGGGAGWMIFTHYRAARQAAQTLGDTAASVELREVTPTTDNTPGEWTAADGTPYAVVPGGLAERIR